MTDRGHLNAHLLMVIYAILVSTAFPVISRITDSLAPELLTFLRFAIATVIFSGLMLTSGELTKPSWRDLGRYGLISLSLVIFFVLMFWALRWTTPIRAGAVFTLMPLISAGIGYILLRSGLDLWQLTCLIVGAAGAIWVVFDGSLVALLGLEIGRGEVLFFIGACAFAAYSPLVKMLHRGETALTMTFWVLLIGTILLGVVATPAMLTANWAVVPSSTYGGLVYLAIFPTAITFSIAKYASVRLVPAKVMAYTYLTPAIVAIMEGVLGAGWPTLSVTIGMAVIGLATLLLQRS